MDLVLLIVIVIAGLLIYALINTIRSLTQEIKEIKNKCVIAKPNTQFTVDTADPVETFNSQLLDNIKRFQTYFDDKKI